MLYVLGLFRGKLVTNKIGNKKTKVDSLTPIMKGEYS